MVLLYFLSAKNQNSKAGHAEKDAAAGMFTCYSSFILSFLLVSLRSAALAVNIFISDVTANVPVLLSGKINIYTMFLQQSFQRNWDIPE